VKDTEVEKEKEKETEKKEKEQKKAEKEKKKEKATELPPTQMWNSQELAKENTEEGPSMRNGVNGPVAKHDELPQTGKRKLSHVEVIAPCKVCLKEKENK
jgi:hypothetical protein